MTNRTCSFPGCANPHDSKGYCATHNSRIRTHGDPHGKRCESCNRPLCEVFESVRTQRFCSDECRPACRFEGCAGRVRKAGWCVVHYSQIRRTGGAFKQVHTWAAQGLDCIVCGAPVAVGSRRRNLCSVRCQGIYARYGASRPKQKACGSCGDTFSLDVRHPVTGSLRRVDAMVCEKCRSRKSKYGMTVFELHARDGGVCHICNTAVDMSLTRKEDVFAASIDHIIPRSRGGSDDPENLALAHFWCNAVKSDREGFTI